MEDNAKLIELLVNRFVEYSKTSYNLYKLKTIDKATDLVSTSIPNLVFYITVGLSILFGSLGLSFWLGEILGNTYLGFFTVAVFYILIGLIIHFFLHTWLKKIISNYMIKKIFK